VNAPLRALRVLGLAALAAALLAASPALAAKKALPPGERIDLNRASVSELMRLPGVGEKRAQAIVAHRAKQPFRRAEDVLAVKGLGKAWFAKARANLQAGATTAAAPGPAAPGMKR
jgi:competence protein ComEA